MEFYIIVMDESYDLHTQYILHFFFIIITHKHIVECEFYEPYELLGVDGALFIQKKKHYLVSSNEDNLSKLFLINSF